MATQIRDQRIHEVLDPAKELTILGEGFQFTEGPIWNHVTKELTFSDIPANQMYRWTEEDGCKLYREPSNNANGNTFDLEGRILTCEHATSRVVREEADGILTILASQWQGKGLNSPNDIVVHSNGDIYFTDPTFGRISPTVGLIRDLDLDFRGVYRIRASSGELELLAKDFSQPNGLAFSFDEKHLYVADTPEMHVRKFVVEADGTLSGGDIFLLSTGEGQGAPDGLKVASTGHIFCAGPGGVHVYEHVDGVCLGVIETPAFCANFTWGGDDFKTFFLTSSNHLYSLPVHAAGRPLF